MKTILFYFSGSGNTYAAARRLAGYLRNACLVPMKDFKETELNQYDRVGILFPIYGTHAPKFVVNQLKDASFLPEQRIFIVATYAGSRGYGVQEVKETINRQDTHIVQEFCVRMPGSYILEYGAFPQRLQNKLIEKSNLILKLIAECIQADAKTKAITPNLLAVAFRRNGMKMVDSYAEKGRLFASNQSCTGCKTCVAICPTDNISFAGGRITWGEKCAQCMACIQWCPNEAIYHPALKKGRKRYHHPQVKWTELSGTARSCAFQ